MWKLSETILGRFLTLLMSRTKRITSIEKLEILKELLVAVDEDQKNTVKVIDFMEEMLEIQKS